MKRMLVAIGLCVGVVAVSAAATPLVVATHAVYAEFAEHVGGEHIEVESIIPSGFCPAHYDLRPSNVAAVVAADVVFYSGMEVWMDTLTRAAGGDTRVERIRGTWNTPPAAAERVEEIKEVLSEVYPEHADTFAANARAYQAELSALGEELRTQAAERSVEEIAVLCIAWQESFVSWLGFEVAATYPPPENLTVRDVQSLREQGEQAGARLVVDNLQSGIGFGGKLAAELGAVHVVLSNFPGAMPDTATVLDLLSRNARELLSALEPLE
ncbi:MAG: metal ABC transporter substrate-binding protein [Candidatus Bipolaricaulota bacterium]